VPALLLIAFIAVPIAELYVIIQVSHVIGGWETIGLLIVESIIGTWLVRREGRRTWQAFSTALEARRPPAREVADGALVIVGGALLLTPGFLSDILGFFVLLPITRPLARLLLLRFAARRMGTRLGFPFGGMTVGGTSFGGTVPGPPRGASRGRRGAAPRPDDSVIAREAGAGEVIAGEVIAGEVVEGEVVDGQVSRPDRLRKPPDSGTPPGP
jgi:UPF0716 protein FxsA